jgi:hypothetical protein
MVPGAYRLAKLAVVRGIGLEPPENLATAHDIAHVEALGARVACTGQQYHRCKQQSKGTDHLRPRKIRFDRETGHNWSDFASHGRASHRCSNAAAKKVAAAEACVAGLGEAPTRATVHVGTPTTQAPV